MRLIAPLKIKMHKRILKQGINYLLGVSSGSIYLTPSGDSTDYSENLGKLFERNHNEDGSSNELENLVHTQREKRVP